MNIWVSIIIYLYLQQRQVSYEIFALIMGDIVKLHVQVCKGNCSPFIIRSKLQVFEVPHVCHIRIVCAIVSEYFDIYPIEKIYAEGLVTNTCFARVE
jgi:hypothetical protein